MGVVVKVMTVEPTINITSLEAICPAKDTPSRVILINQKFIKTVSPGVKNKFSEAVNISINSIALSPRNINIGGTPESHMTVASAKAATP
jgi:hypothetical protein